MADDQLIELVKNVDVRLSRVEQFLPNLATREESHAAIQAAIEPLATRGEMRVAIAPLATREELRSAIAPLTTREELQAAITPLATREELQAAIAPLATREEVRAAIAPLATRDEVKEEGTRLRRYIDVLIEDLRDDNRIVLEHLVALSARIDALAQR